jgi:hypothetical protein
MSGAVEHAPEKVLVMASEPIGPQRLREAIGAHEEDVEVLVMAPALHRSMLRFWMSDADEAIAEADAAQRETVERLGREGIEARGDTAESTLPEAVEDALATFPAERILLFVHPADEERYGEHVDPHELALRVGLPVERFDVAGTA